MWVPKLAEQVSIGIGNMAEISTDAYILNYRSLIRGAVSAT